MFKGLKVEAKANKSASFYDIVSWAVINEAQIKSSPGRWYHYGIADLVGVCFICGSIACGVLFYI